MTRQGGLRECRERRLKNERHSRPHTRWQRGSSCHDFKACSIRFAVGMNRAEQSSDNSIEATSIQRKRMTHTITRTVPSRDSTGDDYRDRKIHDYLLSRGAIHLLNNIPGPDNLQFVDQKSLLYAWPKKLLVGHHARSGDDIHAYLVPLKTSHRVEIYAEHEHGHARLSLHHEGLARYRILAPFNNAYPRDAPKLTKADIARVELLIEWYFVEAGVVPACFLEKRGTFSKQFCNALRYVTKHVGPLPAPSLYKSPMQVNYRVGGPREWCQSSVHVCEEDIQQSLLQQYCPPSHSPFTPAQIKQQSAVSR
jgi:hypothetical protein